MKTRVLASRFECGAVPMNDDRCFARRGSDPAAGGERMSQAKGGKMRVERSLVALLVSAAIAATGCHNNLFQGPDPKGCEQGRLAYNLPPAERLMEPGPGVGGPGPGVIPPMGGGYGNGWNGYGWNDGRRRGDAGQL